MTKRAKGKIFWYSGIAILAGVIMFMSWSSLALSIGSLAFMLIVIGAAMGAQEYPGIMVNSHQVSEDVAGHQFDGIESKRSENRGDYEFDDEIARMGDDHIQHSHELINTYNQYSALTCSADSHFS